jgi:hypothetical protein
MQIDRLDAFAWALGSRKVATRPCLAFCTVVVRGVGWCLTVEPNLQCVFHGDSSICGFTSKSNSKCLDRHWNERFFAERMLPQAEAVCWGRARVFEVTRSSGY